MHDDALCKRSLLIEDEEDAFSKGLEHRLAPPGGGNCWTPCLWDTACEELLEIGEELRCGCRKDVWVMTDVRAVSSDPFDEGKSVGEATGPSPDPGDTTVQSSETDATQCEWHV